MQQQQKKLYLTDFTNNIDMNNTLLKSLDLEIIQTWLDMNFLRAISKYENHHMNYEHELLVPHYCTHAKEHLVFFKSHIECVKSNYGIEISLIRKEPVEGYKFIIYNIIFHFKADTTYSRLLQKRSPLVVDKYVLFGSQEADFKRYVDGFDKDNLHFVNKSNEKYIEKRLKEKKDYFQERRTQDNQNIGDALRDNHLLKVQNELISKDIPLAVRFIKNKYEKSLLKSPQLKKLKQKNDIHINVDIKPKKKQKLDL
jgi:hypothetical protein